MLAIFLKDIIIFMYLLFAVISKEKERNREEIMPIPDTLARKITADFRAEKKYGGRKKFL